MFIPSLLHAISIEQESSRGDTAIALEKLRMNITICSMLEVSLQNTVFPLAAFIGRDKLQY